MLSGTYICAMWQHMYIYSKQSSWALDEIFKESIYEFNIPTEYTYFINLINL